MRFTIIPNLLLTGMLLLITTTVFADDVSPAIKEKAKVCMGCHGVNGNSTNGKYPSLAGQKTTYLYSQLKDFMRGRRSDPEMSPMAATIKDKGEALQLAIYFSSFPPFQYDDTAKNALHLDPAKVEKGRVLVEKVICTMCHGDGLKGMGDVPRVMGQQPAYIAKQLKAFRDGTRTNDGGTMKGALGSITDEQIADLVQFITSQ